MRFQLLTVLIAGSLMMGCTKSISPRNFDIQEVTPFGICYAKLEPAQVQSYSMVVVEPDFYTTTEISAMKSYGTKIVAYATLGEVDPNREYFSDLEELGFLGQNPVWNSYYIDVEKEPVRSLLLKEVLRDIMMKGFDGLFLDTIDAVSPETERGYLQSDMAQLIKEIRQQYPDKIIIQNAGLFLLEETGSYVDAFLTESLASTYNFETNEYVIRPDSVFNARLGYLDYYVQQSEVPYFILDYADSEDHLSKIKSRLDTLNSPYFVSNIALNQLPEKADSVANKLGVAK